MKESRVGKATNQCQMLREGRVREWGRSYWKSLFPGRKQGHFLKQRKTRTGITVSTEEKGRAAQGHAGGKQEVLKEDPPKAGKDILWVNGFSSVSHRTPRLNVCG